MQMEIIQLTESLNQLTKEVRNTNARYDDLQMQMKTNAEQIKAGGNGNKEGGGKNGGNRDQTAKEDQIIMLEMEKADLFIRLQNVPETKDEELREQ